jgi:hypothetical protein
MSIAAIPSNPGRAASNATWEFGKAESRLIKVGK